jgi:hypothetical protein
MSDFPGWTFDPTRREFFYFSRQENCWIYQSGARIQPTQAKITTDPPASQSNAPGLVVESPPETFTDPDVARLGIVPREHINKTTGKVSKKLNSGSNTF